MLYVILMFLTLQFNAMWTVSKTFMQLDFSGRQLAPR